MSDIRIETKNEGFDLSLVDGDFEQDEGLETSILISLFCDRRVTDEQLPDGQKDKRGYWADKYSPADNDKIGSRLWTLARSKRLTKTLREAEAYTKEALQWLLDDGVAASVKAQANFITGLTNAYSIEIQIQRPSGRTSRYQVLWDKQELKRVS